MRCGISTRPTTDDDAPFAIYDAEFADLGGFAYDVPRFLSEDAFALANVDERPPWRWLLLGGPRSGTGVHVDPLYTHAWVYLVQGLKRWIFLPSNLSRDELRALGVGEPQLPSAQWFARYRDKAAALPGTVELVQRPGELVYVPAGRPHAVLNLEWSYALTHNYAVLSDACVLSTSREEPEFFYARGGRCLHQKRAPSCGLPWRWLGPRDAAALVGRRGRLVRGREGESGDRHLTPSSTLQFTARSSKVRRAALALPVAEPRRLGHPPAARRAAPLLAHGRVDEHVLHVVVVVVNFGVDGDAAAAVLAAPRRRGRGGGADFGRRSAGWPDDGRPTAAPRRRCPQQSQRERAAWCLSGFAPLVCGVTCPNCTMEPAHVP